MANDTPNRSYTLYTDGACAGNPGPGGWGAIILEKGSDEEIILSGGEKSTTNNIMEMTAVLEGVKKINSLKENPEEPVAIQILSDSQYVVKGLTSWIWNWIRSKWHKSDGKPVLNRKLWEALLEQLRSNSYKLQWVRGHEDNVYNNRCDALAVSESLKYKKGETS